jgi:S-adenosylmethionine hydrolase
MRPVALLTDFGIKDQYVGVLHAVLERDSPGTIRIDLGHCLEAGDISGACFQLRCAWPHLPGDCVVMAVVDPGVGTGRRAVAVTVGSRSILAPDNGLADAIPGATFAVDLDWQKMGLAKPSKTFHGRDIFAPAAARLAKGGAEGELGDEIALESLVRCPLPAPVATASGVEGVILHVDRFGNLVTNVLGADSPEIVAAGWHAGQASRRVDTYGEAVPEEVVVLEGSSGYLELAVNCGSAADATGLRRGDGVVFATSEE